MIFFIFWGEIHPKTHLASIFCMTSGIMEKSVYADGEYGADTYCLAPKLDQTDLVFGDFWASVSAEPELKNLTDKRKYDIYIPMNLTLPLSPSCRPV